MNINVTTNALATELASRVKFLEANSDRWLWLLRNEKLMPRKIVVRKHRIHYEAFNGIFDSLNDAVDYALRNGIGI